MQTEHSSAYLTYLQREFSLNIPFKLQVSCAAGRSFTWQGNCLPGCLISSEILNPFHTTGTQPLTGHSL